MLGDAAASKQMVVLSPIQTVLLEHEDRLARLRDIVDRLGIEPKPWVSVEVVSARDLPRNFPADTPVLRVQFAEKSFFDTADAQLRQEADPILSAVAETLRGDTPDTAIFVAGHTDNRGSESYNYDLSMRRAEAVAKALYARNVGDVALWRVGFGEAAPLYANDSESHMAFNRRVEFLFAARTEAVLERLKTQLDNVCVASTSAQSAKCRTELQVRAHFEAIQVTNRKINVALAGAPPGASRRLEVSAKGRSIDARPDPGKAIDVAPRRIALDLRARRYTIEMPVN